MSELIFYESSLIPSARLTGTGFQDAVTFFENLSLSTAPIGRRLRTLPSNAWKVVHATLGSGYAHAWVDVQAESEHLCIHAAVLGEVMSPRKVYIAHRHAAFMAACGEITARAEYSLAELVERVTVSSSVGPWDGAVKESRKWYAMVPAVRLPPHVALFEDVLLDAESRAARLRAFERLPWPTIDFAEMPTHMS